MKSSTARTLEQLRKDGWLVQPVERWNAFAKVRQDLFGIMDVLAVRDHVTLGVQATVYSKVPTRVKKLNAHPNTAKWLRGNRLLEVWGWQKKEKHWTYRRVVIMRENGDE